MPIELQTNVALMTEPAAPRHLVHVQYLEEYFSGKIKGPVRLVSTADLVGTYDATDLELTLTATGLLQIDGENVAANDRVLLAGQTTGTQNGIYTVTNPGNGGAAVLKRADDFNSSDKIPSGVSITVSEGDTQANTTWRLTTQGTITLDSTALEFISVTPATGAKKFVDQITGDNTKTEFEVQHNLGTDDVQVQIWNLATKAVVLTDITVVDDNNVEIGFAEAPPTSANYKIIVIG